MQKLNTLKYTLVLLIFSILLTSALYWQGLSGGFIFDDGNSITLNPSIKIDSININNLLTAGFSRETGILKRPISMMSFAMNHALTSLEPFYFKLTNLIIHLFSGVFLYIFLIQIFKRWATNTTHPTAYLKHYRYLLPLLICTAWLLHPLNLTAVLYVVQRMASLSALFSLLGFVLYCLGRERMIEGKSWGRSIIVVTLLTTGTLATFSKESGALLPLFFFIIECCVFRFSCIKNQDKKFLIWLYITCLAIPTLLACITLWFSPESFLEGYKRRPFTLYERVLTESRILFFYLQQAILPIPSSLGLFHDGFTISQGMLKPVTTVISLISIVILLLFSIASLKKHPIISFSILWYFGAHSLESTVLPLELVFEHRNYLALIGPLILFFTGLIYLFQHNIKPALIISTLCLVLLSVALYQRSYDWENPHRHVLSEVKHHPESSRANDYAGMIYARAWKTKRQEAHRIKAIEYFRTANELNTNSLKPLFSLLELEPQGSHPALVDEIKHRLTTGLFHLSWLHTLENQVRALSPIVDVETLIHHLLNNHLVPPAQQADLYNLLAIHADKNNNQNLAGEYIKKACTLNPENILFDLGYAHWLTTQDQRQKALEVLSKAKEKPMTFTMRSRIDKKIKTILNNTKS